MTNDQLKENVILKVVGACMDWATVEQRIQLETAIRMALYRVTLTEEETALSTEVVTPNEDYLKQFLMIKMVKGLSEKSLRLYTNTIRKFFDIVNRPVADVTANDIRYYLAMRKQQRSVTNATLNNELLHLRSFFGTLNVEELIPVNPTAKIDRIKVEKRQKEPFTEIEVELLRRAALNPRTKLGHPKRDLAIVEVLYSTGCRVGELVTIRRSDINGEKVKVIGKGNKERYVYLNPRAQMAIIEYLETRTDTFDWLFPGYQRETQGRVMEDKPMERSSVGAMIRNLGKRAGVDHAHPHRFRRTAATIALRRGMPIEQVSRMLGHENLTTTQIYAITADEDVQRNHQKYLT